MYLRSTISSSTDLAALLNSTRPLTAEDAAEGPLQWGGFWLAGNTYEINKNESTDTRCVLDGMTAAVDWDSKSSSWKPVRHASEQFLDGEAVVIWDYKEVYLAHGRHSEVDHFDTLAEAEAHFHKQVKWMSDYAKEIEEQLLVERAEEEAIENARVEGYLLSDLNFYEEDHAGDPDADIWQDLITRHDLYDRAATEAADLVDDAFVTTTGRTISRDQQTQRWS